MWAPCGLVKLTYKIKHHKVAALFYPLRLGLRLLNIKLPRSLTVLSMISCAVSGWQPFT